MSSGFISEAELAERRRVRQEEWDKVRKPDDPEEAPEEQFDHRSLFERLEEQKQKRDMEYEEAHKLKNMIKGLDDDEVEFLDLVDRTKLEQERLKSSEEAREIKEFREKVASLQEHSLEQRISTELRQPARPPPAAQTPGLASLGGRSSQMRLLAGAVVRKRPADQTPSSEPKKVCPSPDDSAEAEAATDSREVRKRKECDNSSTVANGVGVGAAASAMRCIGILPGLGSYHDSSDSEQSSDTDQELASASNFDLLGRKMEIAAKKPSQSSSER